MKREAAPGAHRIRRRVLYADTDTMGVVYHAGYLRFCEAGRAELMRNLGLPYRDMEAQGRRLPVIEAHLKFLASARYDDELDIHTWVDEVTGASITFRYLIEKDGVPLVECMTRHTCLDKETSRVVRLPDALRRLATTPGAEGLGPA